MDCASAICVRRRLSNGSESLYPGIFVLSHAYTALNTANLSKTVKLSGSDYEQMLSRLSHIGRIISLIFHSNMKGLKYFNLGTTALHVVSSR